MPFKVQFPWAEYELRRRVHFALELLLASLTDALRETAQASVRGVLSEWARVREWPKELRGMLGRNPPPFAKPWASFAAMIPAKAFLDAPLDSYRFRPFEPCPRAIAALALLAAARRQAMGLFGTEQLQRRKKWTGEPEDMERAFDSLVPSSPKPIRDVLEGLLSSIVIPAHLQTTLRKMGQGQKCSLRFFPDGDLLRPTGQVVYAGYSGSRLDNVVRMLTDIGIVAHKSGHYSVTARGQRIMAQLRGDS
jgi:hypothetical protein